LTAVSAVSSFSMEIFPDGSAKCSRLMVKSFSSFSRKHFEIDHLTKGSGFQPDELTQPSPFPGGLMQLFGLTAAAIGLTPPSIPTPDEGVKTPSDADVRTTCFDVLLLAVPGLTLDASVRVLATFGRHVDADDALMKKTFKQLITNEYC